MMSPSDFTELTKPAVQDMLRCLISRLGTTAVAFLTGATDRGRLHPWIHGQEQESLATATQRICAAHRAWEVMAAITNDDVARQWFIAANPELDQRSPIEALREGEVHQVLKAARIYSAVLGQANLEFHSRYG